MKHVTYVAIFVATLIFTPIVQATVGGPTTIGDFRYNPSNESVYYTQYTSNGRGCPPTLHRMSLNTEISEQIFSCEEGEGLLTEQDIYSFQPVTNFIHDFVGDFKKLLEIDLRSNGLEIDVDFVENVPYSEEYQETLYKKFSVNVYQDGRKVKDFEIQGCKLEQPFLFSGYSIPGFNKRIMLVSSAKGDCFEGGYINEKIYTIGELDDISREGGSFDYKNSLPLTLNERSLVVYESENVSIPTPVVEEKVEQEGEVDGVGDTETLTDDFVDPDQENLERGFEPESKLDSMILLVSLLLVLLSVVGIVLTFKRVR